MKDMPETDGESKARKRKSTRRADPWFKRYPDDFHKGTRSLSLEARGAYNDILDMIYMNGGPIPDDDFQIACALRVKLRKWQALRKQLFGPGKLILRPEGISNERAERELSDRETTAEKYASRIGQRKRPDSDNDEKPNENNAGDAQSGATSGTTSGLYAGSLAEAEAEDSKTTQVAAEQPAAAAALVDVHELSEKLFASADGALSTAASLRNMATPLLWLGELGFDLDRDVLPTVRAVALRERGKNIRHWGYFTEAIAEAKTERERPRTANVTHLPAHRREWEERARQFKEANDRISAAGGMA